MLIKRMELDRCEMTKEKLADALWKTLVKGVITSNKNKKEEVYHIELRIMDEKNDC
ncbi:hypothetical protein P4278_12830 [Bacillus thuringiensis]|nr:hypothetical protein [Bacillus thuringiensis]MED2760003.1 hypothetical protein [Bacillus thuringiensis]MED2769497.1 hypothetical protein [Bacillus thuringiensis]MED2777731.1 hypothetical protein [Bacillus thuringiensis]MED2780569.1 hypothetical protein [Bacillus thuringiensis]